MLNADQKLGIRNFLVDLLIKNVTDESSYSENHAFINKLNMNIVQVHSSLPRSLNKNGLHLGLTSSVRFAPQVKPIRIYVKIILNSYLCLSNNLVNSVMKSINSGKTLLLPTRLLNLKPPSLKTLLRSSSFVALSLKITIKLRFLCLKTLLDYFLIMLNGSPWNMLIRNQYY